MRLSIVAVGTRMPDWVQAGVQEYLRRLPSDFGLQVHEIPLARRSRNSAPGAAMAKEAEAILARTQRTDYLVTLDVQGRRLDTGAFSRRLDGLRQAGRDVVIVVGGPDGLDPQVLQRADESWSLSDLALSHPLVRIVVAEQFYRAWSLLHNHPYHRE